MSEFNVQLLWFLRHYDENGVDRSELLFLMHVMARIEALEFAGVTLSGMLQEESSILECLAVRARIQNKEFVDDTFDYKARRTSRRRGQGWFCDIANRMVEYFVMQYRFAEAMFLARLPSAIAELHMHTTCCLCC